MIDFRGILNTLLIGLTLSTVILTLIVYFVFKLKQGALKKSNKLPHFLEGTYFRRISPQLENENKIANKRNIEIQEIETKKTRVRPWMIFLLIFGSVIIFLLIDQRNVFMRSIELKMPDKEQYQELSQQGLLKDYNFEPNLDQNYFQHYKTTIFQETQSMIDELRPVKVTIYRNELTNQREYNLWKDYLKSLGINLNESERQSIPSDTQLIILPSTTQLSFSELQTFHDKIFFNKMGLLAIGPSGQSFTFSGHPNPLFATLGLNFEIQCKNIPTYQKWDRQKFPISFSPTIPVKLPTHAMINILQNGQCEPKNNQNNSIFVLKSLENERIGLQFFKDSKSNLVWSNLSPPPKPEYGSLEDLFWVQTILYLSRSSHANLSRWKLKDDFVISFAITSDRNYSGMTEIQKKLIDLELPSTTFLPNKIFKENATAIYPPSQWIQYASQSETNEDLSKYGLEKLFRMIQSSRQNMEIQTKQPVLGFRFPLDQFSWELFSSVQQNHFHYVLGTHDFQWRQPIPLAQNFYYIPTNDWNLKDILQRKDIATSEDFTNYVRKNLKIAQDEGAHVVIKIDPDVFSKLPYSSYLNDLLISIHQDYKSSVFSLERVVQDFIETNNLSLMNTEDGLFHLENHYSSSIAKIKVWTDHLVEENENIRQLKSENDLYLYEIQSLEPQQSIELKRKEIRAER